jgi:hypothetical protein
MSSMSPKKAMEKMETVVNALEQLAPNVVFGGMKAADYNADVQRSRDVRADIADLDDQIDAKNVERGNIDDNNLAKLQLIVNGVIGDPNFGPDSALYEAMGYVRKSARKSGLTRKKKVVTP